ncbi:MAG: PEP-CTERM sorting domain-containing protein, partial [Verrucomicrobiota bacterium]
SLTLSSLDRASGGVFRFSGAGGTTGTTVTPGGGLSSTNGIGNVFATYHDSDWIIYNPGTGAVGQFTGYTSLAGATATSNVNVNGSATVSSAQTINSLRIVSGAGGQAVTVNDVLTVGSGGILRAGGNHNYSINGTGTLSTGSNELVIHNNSNNQIAVNAQVASNGVTINSGNRIIFNNATNNFGSGDFNIVRGAARFSYGVTFTGNFHQAAENVDFFSLQLAHSDVTTFEREARINGFIVPVGANTPSVVVAETGIMTGYGESRVTTTIEGAINPGVAERGGTLLFTEGLTLGASSFTFIDLGGTLPGDAGAFYDQINSSSITEGITILDGAELEVSLSTTFIPDPSDIFYIINREDGGTFDTTFEGLEEGAFVSLGDDYVAEITYLANWTGNQATSSLTGGNDIALYNVRLVPEPASAGLLLMGALAVALRRRRR